jgi:hypothetical protein
LRPNKFGGARKGAALSFHEQTNELKQKRRNKLHSNGSAAIAGKRLRPAGAAAAGTKSGSTTGASPWPIAHRKQGGGGKLEKLQPCKTPSPCRKATTTKKLIALRGRRERAFTPAPLAQRLAQHFDGRRIFSCVGQVDFPASRRGHRRCGASDRLRSRIGPGATRTRESRTWVSTKPGMHG